MTGHFIPEPELEFGGNQRHVDIRYGLTEHGPLDAGDGGPREIRLGVVGDPETVNGFGKWLDRCKGGVPAKKSRFHHLYAPFPGFGEGTPLPAPLTVSAQQEVQGRSVKALFGEKDNDQAVRNAVDLFFAELEHIDTNKGIDVLVCAPPIGIWELMDRGVDADGEAVEGEQAPASTDFHDLLKAKGLSLSCPIQIIWPPTYTGRLVERKRRRGGSRAVKKELQDEATRAWNLYVGLYYKGKGIPWRLIRDAADYTSCFVGVSFYEALSGETLQTSVAQVFNERGEGIILNGGPAYKSDKGDRQTHLKKEGAKSLLTKSLEHFRREHKTTPARVVVHKVSRFTDEEAEGFWAACDEERIEILELVYVNRSKIRLFRGDYHAPLRGTFMGLDRHNSILYTRGSIEFYQTYPGLYVPSSVVLDVHEDGDPLAIGREVLSLTKMSWNNTQIDNLMPVTIEASRKVSDLLKYVEGQAKTTSYRYFM